MGINPKKLCVIGISIAIVLFILMLFYVWNFTIDDAFISFRYAEHLANGFGLVWNIGQPPVEGYTNFLWVAIIALTFLLKLNPVFSGKIMGLLSVFGIIVLFWFISSDMFKSEKNKFIAFTFSTIFFLINSYTAIHTISDLETMLFAFLLLAVMYCAWKIVTSGSSKFVWLFAGTALLLSLARPEGILVSLGLTFSIIYIYYKNDSNFNLNLFLPVLILYFTPIIIYNIFRVLYFHEIFPLPFLVKILNGHTYPAEFLSALIYLTPFLVIILISYVIKNKAIETGGSQNKPYFKYFLLILGITFFFADVVYVSPPVMNISQRFFYPSFVMVYAVFGTAICLILNEIKLNTKLVNYNQVIFIFIIISLLIITNLYVINDLTDQHDYAISFDKSYVPMGEALSSFSKDNYTVAFGDAGAVAYFSGWNFMDFTGLNDKYIAKNGVTTEYLEQKHPELVIFASENGEILSYGKGKSYNYVLENNYTQLEPIKISNHYFVPFLKPGIKDYESIKNALEAVSKESNS